MLGLLAAAPVWGAQGAHEVALLPGGDFAPLFGADPRVGTVAVAPFRLDVSPVTNAEFFAFTLAHTEWSPAGVDEHLVDGRYLSHWERAGAWPHPLPAQMNRPVTLVSWFAADAYCHAQGGALPTVFQWEFAAAASETRPDARKDPRFIEGILAWYSRPFQLEDLGAVGQDPPNFFGVRGLHRLVWEWTDDFDSPRFTAATGRGENDPTASSCGTGALGAQGIEDYAAFMRFAMRSSLQASYTSSSLGFRCAYAPVGPAR